jgi:hypothetical protein
MAAESKTLGKVLEFGHAPRERARNSKGGYSYLADSYRKAHRQLVASGHMGADTTPADLQAITWTRWRDLMPAKQAGTVGHTDTPDTPKNRFSVLANLDHVTSDDDHYDDEEHFLDPFGGPPDELDPDLHAHEQVGWEGSDDDDESYDELPADDDYTDLVTDRRKEGSMYNWSASLKEARQERLTAQAQALVAPLRPVVVPVQYLAQVPHHLASGMDEFGFEPHEAIAVPSEQWQDQHSPGARNPGSTAPPGFGDPLDPLYHNDVLGDPPPDERTLAPGPVMVNTMRGPGFNSGYDVVAVGALGGGGGSSYAQAPSVPHNVPQEPAGASDVLAEHQAALEWLKPPGAAPDAFPGASPGMSREATMAQAAKDNMDLAAGADAFLRTGSIPVPGFEVNMDTILGMPQGSLSGMSHDARSRDFTPAEQDEMVSEGEHEGAKASNLHMLRLEGSMYEELERQVGNDDQAQDSANAFWW